ncbi:MAG TPA: hypothetical protein VKT49_04320 [Bryobacteraceae bacterium]|nr:hypothetical protein [Bryobacteraceae bacterium]
MSDSGPLDMGIRNWRYDLLWVGLFAVGLSGGLYFVGLIRQSRALAAPLPSLPPSACIQSPVSEPQTSIRRAAAPNERDKVPFSMPADPAGKKPGSVKARGRTALSGAPDPSAPPQAWRLQGNSPFVILGLEAPVVRELSRDPDRLHDLIQTGSLFTVPRGTAIQVREVENGVIKIEIKEGSMAGREGWVQASQITPRYGRSGDLRF